MARGDKNYKDVVRKVNKGQKSDKKVNAVHKMVEALIQGDSDDAAEQLHIYLQAKTRDILLGEAKDEDDSDKSDDKSDDKDDSDDKDKPEKGKKGVNPFAKKDSKKDDDKKDSDDSDDDKDDKDDSDDKEDVKESVGPKANLTKARGPEWAKENVNKGAISGNSLKSKPKKSNDTQAKAGIEKHGNDGGVQKDNVEGNSLKSKPKKSNDTQAKGPKFAKENANKGKVAKGDDGCDYDMGTGNV